MTRLGRGAMIGVVFAQLLACAKPIPLPGRGGESTVGQGRFATTVYLVSQVRTLDPERPIVEALAMREGKLLATGSHAEVLAAAGPEAHVIRLPGAHVVPGLQDAHGHLSSLGRSLVIARLEDTRSFEEVLARLKSAPATSFQGEWLLGRGWDQHHFPDGAMPTRAELDAAFPVTPIVLTRIDGHAVWANGEALRRAGVHAGTPEPSGGRILRDAAGEPTGVLVDHAMSLVTEKLPEPTNEQLADRLRAALARCAEAGITTVHDAGMDLRSFRILQSWDLAGLLPLRVYAMADGQGADARAFLEQGRYSGSALELRAVKFLMDGALGSRGAALHAPYADAPEERGLLLWEPEALEAEVTAFMEAGFQIAIHAIGDRANTVVLELLERAMRQTGTRDGRHRLEHAQVLRPEELPRVGALGLVASVQPTHATSDLPWAAARLGEARLAGAYAWKSLKSGGAVLALGSDFPVEAPDVLRGLYAARTRQTPAGQPTGGFRPAERLSGEEALEGFTTGAAWASFSEQLRGRLVPGMQADFVVLDADVVAAPASVLLEARVLETVVNGRRVYAAP